MVVNKIIQGDCLIKLKELDDNSVDSIVCDPPYELGFMGKSWDNTGIANNIEMWKECLRVLKPGGHLLAFSGTRTYHRMASAIEDAGFEVRNQLIWAFGQGFPKSKRINASPKFCQCVLTGRNGGNTNLSQQQGDHNNKELGGHDDDLALSSAGHLKNEDVDSQGDYQQDCGSNDGQLQDTLSHDQELAPLQEYAQEHNHSFLHDDVQVSESLHNLSSVQYNDHLSNQDCSHHDFSANAKLKSIHESNKLSEVSKSLSDKQDKVSYKKVNELQVNYINGFPICQVCGKPNADGWGTQLKPAFEPICMAMKPLSEKGFSENCLKWGTGGINIDVSRVSADNKDDDNSENIVLSHKLFELRRKIYTLLFSFVAGKKDCPTPANDDECVVMWRKLEDYQDYYSPYYRLYDGLSPLFLKGDQVSAQQLHDALGDIDRLRKEQNNTPSNQYSDHLSNLDDFYQLILSYDCVNNYTTNYTTLNIESQAKRFPANLIHDNSEEVRECFPESKSVASKRGGATNGNSKNIDYGDFNEVEKYECGFNDSGNASRFFKSIIYQAKSSKSDRNKGLDCYLTVKYNRVITNNNKTLCKEENMVAVQLLQKVISEQELVSFNIDESGVNIMAQCHKDSLSTILTETNRIIGLKIYSSLMHSLTNESIQDANLETEVGGSLAESVADLKRWILTTTKGNQELALGASRVVCQMLQLISVEENWKEKTNTHSTVKPIALMEYLIKMVTPKGGIVLDPFAGSGSTLVAAKQNGFQYIGIEMTEEYIPIIEARLNAVQEIKQQTLL